MALRGNNFFHHNKVGNALLPASIAAAGTGTGTTISEPWRRGRQLSFILLAGAMGGSSSLTATIQGLRRDDGTTWEALKESDGITNLAFTPANMDDAGQLETDGYLLGTMDLNHIDGITYSAVRLVLVNDGTPAVVAGAAYVISDCYRLTDGEGSADLFDKLHPGRP